MVGTGKILIFLIPTLSLLWCPGEDSNLHALRHMHLKHASLPISAPGRMGTIDQSGLGRYFCWLFCSNFWCGLFNNFWR